MADLLELMRQMTTDPQVATRLTREFQKLLFDERNRLAARIASLRTALSAVRDVAMNHDLDPLDACVHVEVMVGETLRADAAAASDGIDDV